MKLSSEQYKDIRFRKRTLHEKLSELELMISGRDTGITQYIRTEQGKYSETSIHHFLKELMDALNHYIIEQKFELDGLISPKWKEWEEFLECIECFLYCVIRLMDCNLESIQSLFLSSFPQATFNQILDFSKNLGAGKDRYYPLFIELYYGSYEQLYYDVELEEFFWYCDWIYEDLTEKNIIYTISDSLKETVAHLYDFEIEMKHRTEMEEAGKIPDKTLIRQEFANTMARFAKNAQNRLEQWKKNFENPEIFCEKYLTFRKLYFEGILDTCGNFTTLIEGMLDIYLAQKGLSGYADDDFFITAFTHLRKATGQIEKLKEEE